MTNVNVTAEKIIAQLRRQLDAANYQTAVATAAAEQAAEQAAAAHNRVGELEAELAARDAAEVAS